MTVFPSLLIQDHADISYPTLSTIGFWLGRPRASPVIIGYPTPYLESFICLFLLLRVYVRGAAVGLHQSYRPRSFVKCCYVFQNVYLMFKGVDIIFLSAHLMFLVVVFMCYWGCFMLHTWILMISFKIWSEWYFIIHNNQSWISVQIALNLVCKPISYFICHFYNRLRIKT